MAIKSKKIKLTPRERQKHRIRQRVSGSAECPRLSVYKSSKHTYAQIVCDVSGKTIASASTLDAEVVGEVEKVISSRPENEAGNAVKSSKGVNAARAVGIVLARRVKEKKIERAVFDRNGFIYCGRVQAVADGARAGGLKF